MGFEYVGGKCVFSSEWDADACKTYEANFNEKPAGDITKIDPNDIPDHDILLGGFPCQPFLPTSFSGNPAQFIVNLINNTFKYSGDVYQNVSYLETSIKVLKNCSLTYEQTLKRTFLIWWRSSPKPMESDLSMRWCYLTASSQR